MVPAKVRQMIRALLLDGAGGLGGSCIPAYVLSGRDRSPDAVAAILRMAPARLSTRINPPWSCLFNASSLQTRPQLVKAGSATEITRLFEHIKL